MVGGTGTDTVFSKQGGVDSGTDDVCRGIVGE